MANNVTRLAKTLPVARLMIAGEILLMAQQHVTKLSPAERRRVGELVWRGHGRPSHLSERDRLELSYLVAKAQPRLFVGHVAQRFSPVPLPKRVVQGPKRGRAKP